MIKEEIKKLNIDLEESFLSGDYEKVITILKLIIDTISKLENKK